MESPRLPRFRRAPTAAMRLTDRDHQIIKLVHHHRFLRSPQIASLVGGSPQQILRRLQLLYHHGYLERPRAQLNCYHEPGYRHIVYGLGKQGSSLLKPELGASSREDSWGENNDSVGRLFLAHALLVSDVMVALKLACREDGQVRFVGQDELRLPGEPRPFRWRVQVNPQLRLGVVPDQTFALEYPDQNGKAQRSCFFLEADRGTMPVRRRDLSQTSFYRKLLAYEATWTQNLHRTQLGFDRFRVLTVTTSAARVESLVSACAKMKRGRGLFLFADKTILEEPGDLLSVKWQTGREGELASLLD